MNPQPKALVLADALDAEFVQGRISNSTGRESAVELRRLHEALETEQEPVERHEPEPTAWQCQCGKAYTVTCISSKPAKREWVGLTAYEIQEIHSGNQHWGDFACAIEAKLKERNT